MKIMDRYILTEMMFPFLYGVAAFTVLFMSVSSSELISNLVLAGNKGGISLVIKYLLSVLPQVLVYTFPMGVLLSTLMAFGRLSGDSEIVAMKAGGISFFRIGIPGLILTFMISLVSMFLMEKIVPDANYNATNIVLQQMVKQMTEEKQNLVFSSTEEDGTERRIFAKKLDETNGILKGVVILYFKGDHRQREIYAPEARWENNVWKLIEPRTYDFNENQNVEIESYSAYGRLPVSESPNQLSKRERKTAEMPREMLTERIGLMKDVAKGSSISIDGTEENYGKLTRKMEVALNQRLALPFTCFVFGLFGIPLGLRPHRTNTSVGLGLSLVFILFYYILMTAGQILGEGGTLSPFMGSWIPNIVFGILGIFLFINARKS